MNYEPAAPPSNPVQLAEYLNRELRRISQAIAETAPVVHYAVGQLTPTTWSANNYKPPGLDGANVVRISASATQTLTGIALTEPYRQLSLVNIGTGVVALTSEDAASSASARFALASTINLSANAVANLWYDPISSRWRCQSVGGIAAGTGGGSGSTSLVDVQIFTTPGANSWVKPPGAKTTTTILIGAGSGGSGGSKASTNNRGTGGAGGGISTYTFDATSLSASVTVTVGAGGTGGLGANPGTLASVSGGDSTAGGDTTFGAYLAARGGGVASVSGANTSATGGGGLLSVGGNGLASTTNPTVASGLRTSPYGASGGGSGGGSSGPAAPLAGADGPTYAATPLAGGTAGANSSSSPTAGGAGTDSPIVGLPGTGGGGGGAHTGAGASAGFGAVGGRGGYPGGGGGGGGSGGIAGSGPPFGGGGDGAAGADGQAIVITYLAEGTAGAGGGIVGAHFSGAFADTTGTPAPITDLDNLVLDAGTYLFQAFLHVYGGTGDIQFGLEDTNATLSGEVSVTQAVDYLALTTVNRASTPLAASTYTLTSGGDNIFRLAGAVECSGATVASLVYTRNSGTTSGVYEASAFFTKVA